MTTTLRYHKQRVDCPVCDEMFNEACYCRAGRKTVYHCWACKIMWINCDRCYETTTETRKKGCGYENNEFCKITCGNNCRK